MICDSYYQPMQNGRQHKHQGTIRKKPRSGPYLSSWRWNFCLPSTKQTEKMIHGKAPGTRDDLVTIWLWQYGQSWKLGRVHTKWLYLTYHLYRKGPEIKNWVRWLLTGYHWPEYRCASTDHSSHNWCHHWVGHRRRSSRKPRSRIGRIAGGVPWPTETRFGL